MIHILSLEYVWPKYEGKKEKTRDIAIVRAAISQKDCEVIEFIIIKRQQQKKKWKEKWNE